MHSKRGHGLSGAEGQRKFGLNPSSSIHLTPVILNRVPKKGADSAITLQGTR